MEYNVFQITIMGNAGETLAVEVGKTSEGYGLTLQPSDASNANQVWFTPQGAAPTLLYSYGAHIHYGGWPCATANPQGGPIGLTTSDPLRWSILPVFNTGFSAIYLGSGPGIAWSDLAASVQQGDEVVLSESGENAGWKIVDTDANAYDLTSIGSPGRAG